MTKAKTKDGSGSSKWVQPLYARKPTPRPISYPPDQVPTHKDTAGHRRSGVRIYNTDGLHPWQAGAERYGALDIVYFVRMHTTDAYKIGFSHHGRQRLSALRAGIPVPLKMVAWVSFFDSAMLGEAEFRAHELVDFYGERLKGEWFNLREGDIRKIVDALAEGMGEEVMGVSYDGDLRL